MSSFRTRFAPSPTGYLHLGHAASALVAYNWAQDNDADFVLRIEDIDRPRCRPEFDMAIREDLHWLGINWPTPVRRQSEHLDEYETALQTMIDQGLLYRCFLTRREVMTHIASAPHQAGDVYHGPAQRLSSTEEMSMIESGKPYAWRLSVHRAKQKLGNLWDELEWQETGVGPNGETGLIKAQPDLLGDVILARKDIANSYHLAVTHDDACQYISHVIRGQDLFESTHIHVLLQALMGWPTPVYHHHGLLLDAVGKRLAKRDGASSLQSLREAGLSVELVRKMAKL